MDLKGTCNNVYGGYILLEASGDSEADCHPNMAEHAYEIHTADDDAQSCSYDESETGNPAEKLKGHEHLNADDDEDGKKADAYGTSYCEDDEMQEHHKSCVSDDSGLEPVDETEKSRLFWEACLAS